jgi:hypothetical protein
MKHNYSYSLWIPCVYGVLTKIGGLFAMLGGYSVWQVKVASSGFGFN